jgi:lipoprotein NlpI
LRVACGLLTLLLASQLPAQPATHHSPPSTPPNADLPAPELRAAARAALNQGDPARALSLADACVTRSPDDPSAYALRAAVHDARRDWAASVADYTKLLSLAPDSIPALHRRGEAHFRLGRFKESVADFDREIALDPTREAHHWQRGLSLYYAGDFARGALQFELHRTVNPDDVENAAWHYLCLAKVKGVEAARAALIPIKAGADTRVPMDQVYALYAGKGTPEAVLAAAREAPEPERQRALMYAHLYIGLWHEVAGESDKARQHITLAAEKYALENDYMSDVARARAATFKDAEKR